MEDLELELYLPKKRTSDEPISSFTEVIGNVPTPWEKGDVITFPATIENNSFKTKIGNKKCEYIVVHVKSAYGNERQANFFPALFRRRVRKCDWDIVDGACVVTPTNDFVTAGGSIVEQLYTKNSKVNDVVLAVLGKSIKISKVYIVKSQEFGSTNPELAIVYDFEPEGWTIGNAPVYTTTDLDATKKIKKTYGNVVGNGWHNGHEWVDLGLSVKWATCNVGESSCGEDDDCFAGDLFAWGETETKEKYIYDNSLTDGLSISALESLDFIDGKGNLTSSYDAANANWGGSWRMPTKSELEELVDNCTWEWIITHCGIWCEVTGPNGNSIFLSAEESCWNPDASYWSSTPHDDPDGAYDLWLGSVRSPGSHFVDYQSARAGGKYVRPVLE